MRVDGDINHIIVPWVGVIVLNLEVVWLLKKNKNLVSHNLFEVRLDLRINQKFIYIFVKFTFSALEDRVANFYCYFFKFLQFFFPWELMPVKYASFF